MEAKRARGLARLFGSLRRWLPEADLGGRRGGKRVYRTPGVAEAARRRRQMERGQLTEANRGVVEVWL